MTEEELLVGNFGLLLATFEERMNAAVGRAVMGEHCYLFRIDRGTAQRFLD
jgi:hypothetical protein